jgi:HEAT repeat protein
MIGEKDNDVKPLEAILEKMKADEQVSVSLLYQLSDLTPDGIGDFCGQWANIDADRRRVIVRHLADISEQNYQVDFTSVFEHCLDDAMPEVRKASLDGLWDSDRLSLISRIVSMMETDADIEVRILAAATLGHYVLLGEWGQIPARSIEPIVDALLEQIDNEGIQDPVRHAALESVSASGHPRVESLIEEAYDSGDLDKQISAMFAMGRSADPRWINIVIDEMSSPITEMRLEAARASGEIGRSAAVPELIELTSDEDLEVQLVAVAALGRIGGDIAQQVLGDMIDDPDQEELYEAATEALDEIDWLGGEIDLSLSD